MNQLSAHFSWEDVIHSAIAQRLGIDNSLPEELILAVQNTANNMEILRSLINGPIFIDSWYRCLELNRILKSPDTSQHLKGEAVDFYAPSTGNPLTICKRLIPLTYFDFDQLIHEHTWIHISFSSDPTRKNRRQVLTLLKDGTYAEGLTDLEGNPA